MERLPPVAPTERPGLERAHCHPWCIPLHNLGWRKLHAEGFPYHRLIVSGDLISPPVTCLATSRRLVLKIQSEDSACVRHEHVRSYPCNLAPLFSRPFPAHTGKHVCAWHGESPEYRVVRAFSAL